MNRAKTPFVIGLVVAVIVATALAAALTFLTAWHCVEGDGGAPYVARDSTQADVCGATGDGWGLFPLSLIPVAVLAVLAWRRFSRRRGLAIGLTLALVVSPIATALIVNAPSDQCSEDERAENDAARVANRIAPNDCDTY